MQRKALIFWGALPPDPWPADFHDDDHANCTDKAELGLALTLTLTLTL